VVQVPNAVRLKSIIDPARACLRAILLLPGCVHPDIASRQSSVLMSWRGASHAQTGAMCLTMWLETTMLRQKGSPAHLPAAAAAPCPHPVPARRLLQRCLLRHRLGVRYRARHHPKHRYRLRTLQAHTMSRKSRTKPVMTEPELQQGVWKTANAMPRADRSSSVDVCTRPSLG